ncbi:enoyl-CoA hydratase [Aquibacillus sp. 3ASR75-11]|uniref:Enoyl-CoA hydratase n=1 Tax=Terrihalobacillus insolitus TaxID=2950438 RepID=A0A9X3WV42_9BACI|nr:MaoC/PaaZ C-terminal domain-containing protein [Terrihalobacillus insolitus]MDC3412624.1 enoyl-CoA hydratase [Terrihalobacillus insolitus]MDC3423974.1 enoyl-CoA hydratase [Terrihalobacillus insolitus]
MLGKKRMIGKKIDELEIGECYWAAHTIEDKELLLYLGLTDDANPLYIQHDYASQTPYKRPLVPSVMLFGMVSTMVSMHLPGPGSHITSHNMTFPKPVYHYSEVKFNLEVQSIDMPNHLVVLSVTGFDSNGDQVICGSLHVTPPYKPESMTASSLDNFY